MRLSLSLCLTGAAAVATTVVLAVPVHAADQCVVQELSVSGRPYEVVFCPTNH